MVGNKLNKKVMLCKTTTKKVNRDIVLYPHGILVHNTFQCCKESSNESIEWHSNFLVVWPEPCSFAFTKRLGPPMLMGRSIWSSTSTTLETLCMNSPYSLRGGFTGLPSMMLVILLPTMFWWTAATNCPW